MEYTSNPLDLLFFGLQNKEETLVCRSQKIICQAIEPSNNIFTINATEFPCEEFVEYGYLMPRFLASMNIKDVSTLLRDFHMKDEAIVEPGPESYTTEKNRRKKKNYYHFPFNPNHNS